MSKKHEDDCPYNYGHSCSCIGTPNHTEGSGKAKQALEIAGGLIAITIAVLVCLLIVKVSLGAYNWVHDGVTTSPQERAALDKEYAAEEAAWAKDPTNPKVVAQKCLDKGGTPIISSWDGHVKECQGVDKSKNVNIEVNQ